MQEAFQLFLYLEDLEIKKINPDYGYTCFAGDGVGYRKRP